MHTTYTFPTYIFKGDNIMKNQIYSDNNDKRQPCIGDFATWGTLKYTLLIKILLLNV